jgi:DNA-binding transcriptional MerR regulator
MYSLDSVANLFDTSRENARRWCLEFKSFLSENANPPEHRKRMLNDDDLAVFSLIAEYKVRGLVFADIRKALERGERGVVPANPSAVVPADKTRLAKLQSDVNRLAEALQVTQANNQRLEGQVEALTVQLEETRRELRDAYKQIGRLERDD